MVSAEFAHALTNPTRTLTNLYETLAHPDSGFSDAVAQHFARIFQSNDAFQEISPLDIMHPPEIYSERSLVRFRCMVQDTSLSSEMYLSKRSGGRPGGWGLSEDVIHGDDSDDRRSSINYDDLSECTVVWATTIPGENTWCSSDLDGDLHPDSQRDHLARQPHKFPIPGMAHVGAQIKIYGGPLPKSTEMFTFVGILTTEPVHAELDMETPTDVPTIHVLYSQALPSTVVPQVYPISGDAKSLRQELITWIADQALAGDRDAAEWVLLTTIANVQSRTPPIMPPSLTLSHFPSPVINTTTVDATDAATSSSTPRRPTLEYILGSILPISTTIPLSLPMLNTTAFAPESKNEDLHSGWLQLPAGSNVLITESGISEGTLTEKGLMNIRSLQEMIASQAIDYVFPFSQFSFPTDVSFIVLSEGKKSAFLQTSINMPLKRLSPDVDVNATYYKDPTEIKYPSEEKLAQFRALVGGAKSQSGRIAVQQATGEHIQEDFVNERRDGTEKVTSDDLIHRMTVARLLALSMHAKEITVEIWEQTKAFDKKRKERV